MPAFTDTLRQKKPYVFAKREEYRRFWEHEVQGDLQVGSLKAEDDA